MRKLSRLPYEPVKGYMFNSEDLHQRCALGHLVLECGLLATKSVINGNEYVMLPGGPGAAEASNQITRLNDEGKFGEAFLLLPNFLRKYKDWFVLRVGTAKFEEVLGNIEAWIQEHEEQEEHGIRQTARQVIGRIESALGVRIFGRPGETAGSGDSPDTGLRASGVWGYAPEAGLSGIQPEEAAPEAEVRELQPA